MWNQISLTLRFLLRAHWLTKNAAPDNLHYQSNLSLFLFFSFTSIGFPLLFYFFLFPSFSLPLSLQMGYLATEREESCASFECTAEANGRYSGSSGSWTRSWDIQQKHNTEVQIQYRYYVCVGVSLGDGGVKQSSEALYYESSWFVIKIMRAFHCSTDDLQHIFDCPSLGQKLVKTSIEYV